MASNADLPNVLWATGPLDPRKRIPTKFLSCRASGYAVWPGSNVYTIWCNGFHHVHPVKVPFVRDRDVKQVPSHQEINGPGDERLCVRCGQKVEHRNPGYSGVRPGGR